MKENFDHLYPPEKKMKPSERITLTSFLLGLVVCAGVWFFFPAAPWWVYIAIVIGALFAGGRAIEDAARDKVARQVLDQ
ncbi:MAG: hypothetical protein LCH79_07950 [Proteobacteria bacterium]|nr:hypothetical protein [Pseudomonadota bacterium]